MCGLAEQISVEQTATSFTASETEAGTAWPNGHAATATFGPGANMSSVRIDYSSINTYVTYYKNPACPRKGVVCTTVTVPARPPGDAGSMHAQGSRHFAVISTRRLGQRSVSQT